MNLITVARKTEDTCKQGCLLCEPETMELTPTLQSVLLCALSILGHGTYGSMSHLKDKAIKCHDGHSNPHSAGQKHLGSRPVLSTSRPRHATIILASFQGMSGKETLVVCLSLEWLFVFFVRSENCSASQS